MSVHFAHASRLKLMVSLFAGDFGKLTIDHRASIAEVLSTAGRACEHKLKVHGIRL